jgi:hypothetical protein
VIVDFLGEDVDRFIFEYVLLDSGKEMFDRDFELCDVVLGLEGLSFVVFDFMEKKGVDFFPFGIHLKL